MTRFTRTIVGGAAALLLAAGAVTGAVTGARGAAGPIVYVGAGGHCLYGNVDHQAYTKIQDAVDGVTALDTTIRVCPGTYREQVTVSSSAANASQLPGLTLWSNTSYAAHITWPPTLPVVQPPAIVHISGITGVTVKRFTIAGPGTGACNTLGYGVLVDNGGDAYIGQGDIFDIRDQAVGACPNGIGVRVTSGFGSGTGPGSHAEVANELITGYGQDGVKIDGALSSGSVIASGTTGSGAGGSFQQTGIEVSNGASAPLLKNNNTSQNRHGGAGILLSHAVSPTYVYANFPGNFNDYGIALVNGTTGATLDSNTAEQNTNIGFWADASTSGNHFKSNRSLGANGNNGPGGQYDCQDDTTNGTWLFGKKNDWPAAGLTTSNHTTSAGSPGICTGGTGPLLLFVGPTGHCLYGKVDHIAYTTIQAAVDFAPANSTIRVCPGTYPERVRIVGAAKNGLTLWSTTSYAAHIVPPASWLAGDPEAIVHVDGATGVTVKRFTIEGPGNGTCDSLRYGVLVDNGGDAYIGQGNLFNIRDQAPGCANGIGVRVTLTSHAVVANELITGYQLGGVKIDGPGSSGSVIASGTIGAGAGGSLPQIGIEVSNGASAPLLKNDNASLNQHGGAGILLAGAVAPTLAYANFPISFNSYGISLTGGTTGATVKGNTATANTAVGFFADASTGQNHFLSNRGGFGTGTNGPLGLNDCQDLSLGAGFYGTANEWPDRIHHAPIANHGTSSSSGSSWYGICLLP